MPNSEFKSLVKRAETLYDAKGFVEPADRDALINELMTFAGRRLFTKNMICHGVYFYPTEQKAIAAGWAVRLRGEKVNGGYFHGMQCGRDSSFDYMDKEHGLVFGVTVA